MNTFSSSNRLLYFANHMRQILSPGDEHTRPIEPRSRAEIARALSRWENEGGAVHGEDRRLMDAYAALS